MVERALERDLQEDVTTSLEIGCSYLQAGKNLKVAVYAQATTLARPEDAVPEFSGPPTCLEQEFVLLPNAQLQYGDLSTQEQAHG
jgi:hypothetical protein